jgi:hypothetical protein
MEIENWEEAVPQFSDPAVFVPTFKATVQAGHFVLVVKDNVIYIGRITATSHSSENEDVPTVFVLHYDDVVMGMQNCAGMENAFFIRYRYNSSASNGE